MGMEEILSKVNSPLFDGVSPEDRKTKLSWGIYDAVQLGGIHLCHAPIQESFLNGRQNVCRSFFCHAFVDIGL